jgi:hypothetical protein
MALRRTHKVLHTLNSRRIQLHPLDVFKYYSSKILAYVIFIGIGTTVFAALANADPSAMYKQTTMHTNGGY